MSSDFLLFISIVLGLSYKPRQMFHACAQYVGSRKSAQKVPGAARPESATKRNSLSAVGGGRQLHAAIFSAQNPVAFSYFSKQNAAAPRRVKLIGLTSDAN